MKTICLDFDDFSVLNNRLDLLLRLKESYPNLKISLFTIPFDFVNEKEVSGRILRDKTLEKIKEQLDWLEIIPHGLVHAPREFENCNYETMKLSMKAIDEAFKKDGLPYVKGFKAPQWLWNKDVVKALDDEGWWGAIDKNNPNMVSTKRYYVYTHSISEMYSLSNLEIIKLHGHITPYENNYIERCFTNLFKMPTDAEFKFASELVQE
jgi:predicted deacetylase